MIYARKKGGLTWPKLLYARLRGSYDNCGTPTARHMEAINKNQFASGKKHRDTAEDA